ncbi:hypothetical protein GLS40_10745 [Pseudooceanicola sp. 216_PA32_1]|uniref:Uncharacterized protein n=1 Tax=Pseudooceanicola pacificus TaxID=2676438 RepID=A0A844W6W9_9RHOB|nr:hypothetical protein [Pseudooceanicola pacificus]MWB78504.1 hypothetical protein [Pseudooceanicola pacificus]
MTEIFTTEIIVGCGLLGVSGLVMIASVIMLRPPRDERPKIDLDACIRDAPYHRLESAGIKVIGAAPAN